MDRTADMHLHDLTKVLQLNRRLQFSKLVGQRPHGEMEAYVPVHVARNKGAPKDDLTLPKRVCLGQRQGPPENRVS